MPKKAATIQRTKLTTAALASEIEKHFGKGTMRMASSPELVITRLPTGILSVDSVLSGGIARGRHTEVIGNFSVGKSYLALELIANTQYNGGTCAYLDVEKSFDPVHAELIGVDLEKLVIPILPNANKMVDFIEALLYSQLYDVIVIDSIAALLPQDEQNRSSEQATMGTYQARLMSAALRKLTTANTNTAIFWINQQREAIGDLWKHMVTSGGRAMGFYAGERLELVKIEDIKLPMIVVNPKTGEETESPVITGHRVLLRIEKSKVGNIPKDQTTFVYDYNLNGVDPIEDLIYLGRRLGLVKKSGEGAGSKWWIEGSEDNKSTGRTRFKTYLRKSPNVVEMLEAAIMETI